MEASDNDADGILDGDDSCPVDPEDKDGFEDADGCPDPDNDRDSILDVDDACPIEPETLNGFEDADGCPDESLASIKTGADGSLEAIIILDRVYFDTNKATIQRKSNKVLNAVVDVMQSFPQIKLVEVQGHTDSDGRESANLELSQDRATAVVRYLVTAGVDPSRLVGRGFGESRPIDTNETSKGKANNRRVEFIILEQEGGPARAQ
jgi:outer membrane protein OmpA-like peptidoglycan-associated protein